MIISEQDIINTYDTWQREHCRLYFEYKRIKQENPKFGYKKLSKLLGEPIHRTRCWHHTNAIPQPILTVNWLKERGLIPLTTNHPQLPQIAKILGATFGDGGIDINHNMIFLSSSELKAVEDFKQDLLKVFGLEIEKNFDIRMGGIKLTSYCQRNTNRNVIRFFKALGAPIGNKTTQIITFPKWTEINKKIEDKFYFSLFGAEVGIPRQRGGQANSFDIAFGGRPEFHDNRIVIMNKIKTYLDNKGIKSGKISINKSLSGFNQHTYIYRLLISTNIENMVKFYKKIQLHYCYYKTDKLKNTLHDILRIKDIKLRGLQLEHGWDRRTALKKLNIKGEDWPSID